MGLGGSQRKGAAAGGSGEGESAAKSRTAMRRRRGRGGEPADADGESETEAVAAAATLATDGPAPAPSDSTTGAAAGDKSTADADTDASASPANGSSREASGDHNDNASDGSSSTTSSAASAAAAPAQTKDHLRLLPPAVFSAGQIMDVTILTIFSILTRTYDLEEPHHVTFDECHFGKFGLYYVKGLFFFDVHPPLGKMLIGFVEWLAGFSGTFMFEELGMDYLEHENTPYELVRLFSAMLGALLVPLVYLIAVQLRCSRITANLAAVMVLCDTALVCQTRLILLDAPLFALMLLALYAHLRCVSARQASFGLEWWFWMLTAGAAMGAALAVKHLAIMLVLTMGLVAVLDLWAHIGDRAVSLGRLVAHVSARLLALVVLPLALYTATFYLHFQLLQHSGPGDSHMSKEFQSGLVGSTFNRPLTMPPHVAYGSRVMIRQEHGQRCWLHSHAYNYPTHPGGDTGPDALISSLQQQVTCFEGEDDANNWWMFVGPTPENETMAEPGLVRLLVHGDLVRLKHTSTGRFLNTHDVAGPRTQTEQEVSCYGDGDERAPEGEPGHMARHDVWRIEVTGQETALVDAAKSVFKLINVDTDTALQGTGEILPDWAFHQGEVVAAQFKDDVRGGWSVLQHVHPFLESTANISRGIQPPGFWASFFELHIKIFEASKRLAEPHPYSAGPKDWLFLTSGGVSFYQGLEGKQVYMIGNPLVWWFSSVMVFVYVVVELFQLLRERRAIYDVDDSSRARFWVAGRILSFAWVLFYVPFFFMDRQLFIHHYLCGLLFAILLSAVTLEHLLVLVLPQSRRTLVYGAVAVALAAVFVHGFIQFAPFAYFLPLTLEDIEARKWLAAWDMQTDFSRKG